MLILTNNLTFNLIGIFITLVVIIISYFKWTFTYWKRKGVTVPAEPVVPFGNVTQLVFRNKHIGEIYKNYYNILKQQNVTFGGSYFFTTKMIIPVDLDLISHIMQKDFSHFVNHGFYVNEELDPLTGHLFSLEDNKWRNLRVKLTPTFTSGKMRMMFQTLADCGDLLNTFVGKLALEEAAVDVKEVMGRFTTDVIGSCAFGIDCNSIADADSDFRKYGKRFFQNDWTDLIRSFSQFIVPQNILSMLRVKIINPGLTDFFLNMVKETVQYREKNNIYRKDFMHLLIQLKNQGKVTDDEKLMNENGSPVEGALSLREVAAQAFVFFIAGFETSSTAMSFALYEIALNSDIQRKIREEIKTVLKNHENKLTYDSIMEMKYLDKVVNESLRKYPPIPGFPRICTKDYVIPNTNVTIKKGTRVAIPTLGIHRDNDYYPNPEVFDPERFNEETKASRPPFTFIPFGEGPRICIGLRFGVMQIKVGLITLLKNYEITLNKKTTIPLEYEPHGFVLSAKGGVWVNVKKIQV